MSRGNEVLGSRRHIVPSVIAALALLVTASRAQAYLFLSTASNASVSASATIATNANSLTVVLTNLETNIVTSAQAISGIQMTLSDTPTSAALSTASGQLIDINNGSFVLDAATISHWGAGSSAATVTLETIGTFGAGGTPKNLIIGPAPYTNTNSGVANFNPYIQNTGTFSLSVPSITDHTMVTAVSFFFGTLPETTLGGIVTKAPEPMSLVLLGTGVIGLGLMRRRTA